MSKESSEIARQEHLPEAPTQAEISEMTMLALKSPDPAGAVEKLMQMRHVEQDRQARREFDMALDRFHGECPSITKTKTAQIVTKSGARYNYDYVPLDILDQTLRPIARKYGLRWKWDSEETAGKLRVTCTLQHVGGHRETSSFSCTTDSKADISGAQKAGAANSYAKRQTLLDVFGLSAYEKDTDGALGRVPTITEDQVTRIHDLIKETGGRESALLTTYGIERLEDLPANLYQPVVDILERRKRG